ncbi:MAG: hypothetical protein WCG95_01985 [bacterium]
MEDKVNISLKDIGKLEDLPTLFLAKFFPLLKPITESKDPEKVLEAIKECNTILAPARTFLSLMKDAGILFLENDGIAVIDDDNQPEWFILHYQKQLENKSVISRHLPIAIMLSHIMAKVKLRVILIASETALALMEPAYMKEDEILDDVLEYKEKNNYLPKIAEEWLKTNNFAKKSS